MIYASAKAVTSASEDETEKPLKLGRLRQTNSKSLDDICLKISKKAKKRKKHDCQVCNAMVYILEKHYILLSTRYFSHGTLLLKQVKPSLSLESLDLQSESNTDDTADLTKILYETLEDLYLETTLAQSKATIYEGLNTLRRKELQRRSGIPFDTNQQILSFDTTVKQSTHRYSDTTQHIDTTEDSVAL